LFLLKNNIHLSNLGGLVTSLIVSGDDDREIAISTSACCVRTGHCYDFAYDCDCDWDFGFGFGFGIVDALDCGCDCADRNAGLATCSGSSYPIDGDSETSDHVPWNHCVHVALVELPRHH
jgi:hypothetical protein